MKAIQSIKKGLAMVLAAALVIGGLYIPADTVNAASVPEVAMALEVGGQEILSVTPDEASPDNASGVTWEVLPAGQNVVSVVSADEGSPKVKITAIGAGECNINAKKNGGYYKKWHITVTSPSPGSQPQIKINPTSVELSASKKSATLTATVTPGNGTVSWSSNESAVLVTPGDGKTATVTATDTTTAKTAEITATVTANGETATATCTVKIIADGTPNVPVQGITLNQTSLSLKVGGSGTLIATVAPAEATNKDVTWESSDPTIATVAAGVVTAKGVGTATITATAGNKTATCTVTVTAATTNVPVTGVSLNAKTLVVGKGATRALTATVAPPNASNKVVTWRSSATAIATVDTKGNVKGIKKGTATITATTADGKKTATCAVTVTEVTLNKTALTLGFGQSSIELKATLSNAKVDRLTSWKTSNATIVRVDARTGKLTAGNKAGTANITVTTQAGATAVCAVTVKEPAVKSVTLGVKKLTMGVKESYKLNATVNPANAGNKKVTWTSDNPKVVKVQNGKLTALKAGKAKITVTSQADKSKKATITVTVKKTPDKKAKVTLNKKKVNLKVKKTFQIKAKISSKYGCASFKYTVDKKGKKVVKVDKNGKVTAKKKGKATITVKPYNGKGKSAKLQITVK